MKFSAAFLAVPAAFAALASSPVGAQTKAAPPAASATAVQEPILCVVKGETIASVKNAAGKTMFNGKTYYFCCPGCVSAFSKASEAQKAKYAKTTDLRVRQMVLQTQLNAVKAELKQTEAAPAASASPASSKGAGLFCAVTGEAIASAKEAAGGKSDFNGKTYYFCCPGCKGKFDAAPAKYAAAADKRTARASVK